MCLGASEVGLIGVYAREYEREVDASQRGVQQSVVGALLEPVVQDLQSPGDSLGLVSEKLLPGPQIAVIRTHVGWPIRRVQNISRSERQV
jgi:hypothetical protein